MQQPVSISSGKQLKGSKLVYLSLLLALLNIQLLIVSARINGNIPNDWIERSSQGNLIYVDKEPLDKNYLPSISNGYLGTVLDSDNIFVGGVYVGEFIVFEKLIGFHSKRARIPATQKIVPKNCETIGSALDIERAMYLRRFQLDKAQIEQRWFAHRGLRSLLVHQINVNATRSVGLVNLQLENLPSPKSEDISFEQVNCPHSSSQSTCYVGELIRLETPDSDRIKVAVVTSQIPSSIQVEASTERTFTFLTSIRTTIDSSDPLMDASIDFIRGLSMDPKLLLSNHTMEWAKLWQSGYELGGNLDLAIKMNTTLYYMLSSTRKDYVWGISPGGIATNSYNGLMFWDQECFVLPSLVYMYPELAHGLIEYRFQRLKEALNHAIKYGYKGAMYPFQSGYSGRTVDLIALFNELEQHITGDIAFALQLYWQLTKDVDWLSSRGYPMAREIATFWESRVTKEQNGMFSIKRVVGPDEFGIGFPLYSGVDNEVFTNAVAQLSLRFANKAAQVLSKPVVGQWNTIADNMTILFDESKQVHMEYEGFPEGNIYFLKYVKQADVVLLGYPLMYDMPTQIRLNDIQFYDKLMWSEGPAMTQSMHTITYLDLKNYTNAAEAFKKSLLNIHPPFNIISETPDPYKHFLDEGSFNFLTGAGGFLQSVQNGYGGLKAYDDFLLLNPQPFTALNVSSIKLRGVHYGGGLFDLYYGGGQTAQITPISTPTRGQFILQDQYGKKHQLTNNMAQVFSPPGKLFMTFV